MDSTQEGNSGSGSGLFHDNEDYPLPIWAVFLIALIVIVLIYFIILTLLLILIRCRNFKKPRVTNETHHRNINKPLWGDIMSQLTLRNSNKTRSKPLVRDKENIIRNENGSFSMCKDSPTIASNRSVHNETSSFSEAVILQSPVHSDTSEHDGDYKETVVIRQNGSFTVNNDWKKSNNSLFHSQTQSSQEMLYINPASTRGNKNEETIYDHLENHQSEGIKAEIEEKYASVEDIDGQQETTSDYDDILDVVGPAVKLRTSDTNSIYYIYVPENGANPIYNVPVHENGANPIYNAPVNEIGANPIYNAPVQLEINESDYLSILDDRPQPPPILTTQNTNSVIYSVPHEDVCGTTDNNRDSKYCFIDDNNCSRPGHQSTIYNTIDDYSYASALELTPLATNEPKTPEGKVKCVESPVAENGYTYTTTHKLVSPKSSSEETVGEIRIKEKPAPLSPPSHVHVYENISGNGVVSKNRPYENVRTKTLPPRRSHSESNEYDDTVLSPTTKGTCFKSSSCTTIQQQKIYENAESDYFVTSKVWLNNRPLPTPTSECSYDYTSLSASTMTEKHEYMKPQLQESASQPTESLSVTPALSSTGRASSFNSPNPKYENHNMLLIHGVDSVMPSGYTPLKHSINIDNSGYMLNNRLKSRTISHI